MENGNTIPLVVPKILIIGSRKSKLAMIQTEFVIQQLQKLYPETEFQIKNIDTTGDNILDKPLAKIGEKALFTRELEEELLAGKIDMIVHSLKDLPTILPDNCCIGAILEREDPSDSLVFRKDLQRLTFESLDQILKDGSFKTFGSSSLRRIAQLKSLSSEISVKDIRGNLNTRLDKLDNRNKFDYDCLILATAGLKRGGFENRISFRLNTDWYHAVSQGALGVECRSNDQNILQLLRPLVDQKTALECLAERVFMRCLEGGCSVPLGVRCSWIQSRKTEIQSSAYQLRMEAKVLSCDGKEACISEASKDLDAPVVDNDQFNLPDYTDILFCTYEDQQFQTRLKNSVILGRQLANQMIKLGVKNILANINH